MDHTAPMSFAFDPDPDAEYWDVEAPEADPHRTYRCPECDQPVAVVHFESDPEGLWFVHDAELETPPA